MEASALKYSGAIGLHGRTPLLRLQSDERLIAMTEAAMWRGMAAARLGGRVGDIGKAIEEFVRPSGLFGTRRVERV